MRTNRHSLRVALVWNGAVFHEKTYQLTSEPVITVGEDPSNMFVVPTEGLPDVFEMFERRRDGYLVRLTDFVDAELTVSGEALEEDALHAQPVGTAYTERGESAVYEVEIEPGDWGMIDLGGVSIFFQSMGKMPIVPLRTPLSSIEWALVGIVGVSALIHGAFLLTANAMFDPQANLDQLMVLNRFVETSVLDIPDAPEPDEEIADSESSESKRADGEEGKFGAKDSEIPESKVPKVDAEHASEIDVANIGVNKVLSSELLGSGPLQNIFDSSDGFDSKLQVAMAGEGGELVVGRGVGGMSIRGGGRGGGGKDGAGRIMGMGKVDVGGTGTGGKIKRKGPRKVRQLLKRGDPKVGDFCDKSNIRRVVKAKSNAIKYCFEKELQSKPELSGKLIAQWRVGLDGKVLQPSIASSTMGNKAVEGCVTRVIKRLRFQKPKGGICVINYPFLFSGLD